MEVVASYIERLRRVVQAQSPALLALFETMAAETLFAREWLDADLAALPRGARILEVGGGTFLLSCLLAEEGFSVTSIEPVGEGFGDFAPLAKFILANSAAQPIIIPCRGEDFVTDTPFDFAFSANVMEHVDDVKTVIARVAAALKTGAHYHFFCPNYLFPYEPHFNIPTLPSKRLTEWLWRKRIEAHPMQDAAGTWRSLNWITVPQVRRAAHAAELNARFDTGMFSRQLERVSRDPGFAARRGAMLSRAVKGFTIFKLHRLLSFLPASFLPTMDITLIKTSAA